MLTRDQVVDMKIISYVDMAFAGMVLAVIAFGLLFFGRPQLFLVPVVSSSIRRNWCNAFVP